MSGLVSAEPMSAGSDGALKRERPDPICGIRPIHPAYHRDKVLAMYVAITTGETLPRLIVARVRDGAPCDDGDSLWALSGSHRLAAYELSGYEPRTFEVPAATLIDVLEGCPLDCVFDFYQLARDVIAALDRNGLVHEPVA